MLNGFAKHLAHQTAQTFVNGDRADPTIFLFQCKKQIASKESGQSWWGVGPCLCVSDGSQLFQNYWFVGFGARVEEVLGAKR